MKTVHEVSKISGVSVRALHHYDAIGLLKPTAVTEAGYRLYDKAFCCFVSWSSRSRASKPLSNIRSSI